MKDYKRLTKWGMNKFSQKPEADLKDKTALPIVAITRLAELEDKIESGELVDRNAYLDYLMAAKDISGMTDKEIEFFVKHNASVREEAMPKMSRLIDENAELRARLDKDGLPVKVGDTIYIVFLDEIKEWQVEKIELCKDEYFVYCGHADTDDYTFVTSKEYRVWWFTVPAEAEVRLKELQERKIL